MDLSADDMMHLIAKNASKDYYRLFRFQHSFGQLWETDSSCLLDVENQIAQCGSLPWEGWEPNSW